VAGEGSANQKNKKYNERERKLRKKEIRKTENKGKEREIKI
jgi:hypothetical protein